MKTVSKMTVPLIKLLLHHQFNDQIATAKGMKKQDLVPPLQKHLTDYIAAMILKEKPSEGNVVTQQMQEV